MYILGCHLGKDEITSVLTSRLRRCNNVTSIRRRAKVLCGELPRSYSLNSGSAGESRGLRLKMRSV